MAKEQTNRKIPGVHLETVATARHCRRDLAQVGLLKGVHQERIMPLLRNCPVLLMSSGEVLMHAGEPCEAVYLVLSGRLRLYDPSSAVPDVLIDAGDTIGELALFQRTVIARSITAIEPSRVVVVDRKVAWKLVGASHEVSRNWLALLATRSRVSGVVSGTEQLKTAHGGHPTLDEPTGLYNRRWLESMLPRQMTRSATANAPLGLLLIEIDGFDKYTTQFGPTAGEHACSAVAEILANGVRPTDLVAAYGAAQFAVVLTDTDGASACQVGERLRQAISSAGVAASDDDGPHALTVSVAATQFKPGTDMSAFLGAAEATLKLVKVSGGNRVGMQPVGS
jgi:diguanylate cyclase (GGDEF)-like protein